MTLAEVDAILADLITAQTNILKGGQSFSGAGRSVARASLRDIESQLRYWSGVRAKLSGEFVSVPDFSKPEPI